MSFLARVTDRFNLRWSWEKVRRTAVPGDVWVDEIELAGFEVELESNLNGIADEISRGTYRMQPLRPMAFPKNPAKDGTPRARQYFHVSIRDQVAWTALVNVLGPHLDSLMPNWSYGNRLFRSIWVDEENGVRRRKIGQYRHSSGRIYLPFNQSWPVFRRHVFLSTMAMTAKTSDDAAKEATDEDLEELRLQEQLTVKHRCPFVQREYWEQWQQSEERKDLFWCSVDLEKFYPSLKLKAIKKNISDFLIIDGKKEALELVDSMLRFSLDTSGWSERDLAEIGLKPRQARITHIPTGLHVAGFLANVGLLGIDHEVAKQLAKRPIAHFRFVDDHIILAYSFKDLIAWIDDYRTILEASGTGAKVNPDKVEPQELACYLSSRNRATTRMESITKDAEDACKLNPEFPTPLMTKTLTLVSAIARTDFNLLEESELISLTDQLEHMLLVDIPAAEIPEKTRLSFTATRLMRLAERRIASDSKLTALLVRAEELSATIASKQPEEVRSSAENKLKLIEVAIRKQRQALARDVNRAFSLLRKVLQKKPDRVRLWTRAIQLCRQTGAMGVADVLRDISAIEKQQGNKLAAEYLFANTYALLGSEVISAALIFVDTQAAEWRQYAAKNFLKQVCELAAQKDPSISGPWALQTSWRMFCFGIFCADTIIKSSANTTVRSDLKFPSQLLAVARNCLSNEREGSPESWGWWAVRKSLRSLSHRADAWVVSICHYLPSPQSSFKLWRFFPSDVPPNILRSIANGGLQRGSPPGSVGWWYDALKKNLDVAAEITPSERISPIVRAALNISETRGSQWLTLVDWCDEIRSISAMNEADPRSGEWTALEIVRQITELISGPETFGFEYLKRVKSKRFQPVCLHPANIRLPRTWLELDRDSEFLTWEKWRSIIKGDLKKPQLQFVPRNRQIDDSRFAPVLQHGLLLFTDVNPVRGLGLLLYGLLQHTFEFPAVWNGPGHSDVLSQLPSLLLKRATYSSWTLGVLQACLQPRATENLILRQFPSPGEAVDNDTLHDPICLLSARQVRGALAKCQRVLEENQISTLNHRARQVTPVSIKQLTQPNWSQVFGEHLEEGSTDEF